MENVLEILERLFTYYKVSSVAELSPKINTSQATISNWKVRNSLNAVKRKCRELDIYDEIFIEKSLIDENLFEDEINTIYEILIDQAKYSLKDKLHRIFNNSLLDKVNNFFPKKILIRVLDNLKEENKRYPIVISKKYLLEEIRNSDINLYEPHKREQLLSTIEKNLSNLECYALINYHTEILQ
jgi:hypothetical protein